ncbi:MAG TPA: N-acetylneuraminate synthase [Verrucomicrobiae bacterium]|nr:N-acetylneuraminate synthase [Verrucomicrobiae bacterium]
MRSTIIAEAGVNHNGSLDLAMQLVDVAHASGANAVKFQTFQAARLVSRAAPKAEYQKRTTDAAESQFEMIRKLELDETAHRRLIERCAEKGIEFISTPFDLESVELLAKLKVRRLKLPSGELTNGPLLWSAARTGLPTILSTGMARLGEIEEALGALALGYLGVKPKSRHSLMETFASAGGQELLREKVTLLHCTTEYPAPAAEVNLRAMDTLAQAFGLPVGLSDHTEGIAVAIAAVARGATVIEKHFTLDRNLPGPDHKASLEPGELKAMVAAIRSAEAAMGSPIKGPVDAERKNMPVARKSLVAIKQIKSGEIFTSENLGVKRPGTGISPMDYWDKLGQSATRDYAPDDPITS